MSKLKIDQKTIMRLFSDTGADFLIPDYQRPYAWGESECQTLWDDLFTFSIPESNFSRFKREDQYYLGPIVTFENGRHQREIIDGQQRLTTLLLLLRAFYEKSSNQKDEETESMRKMIEQCIWKTDEFNKPDKDALKIDSEVATDDDKDEFLEILKMGKVSDSFKSRYAENYRFFEKKINEFVNELPDFFKYLPVRILNNCILLPIEAENQDTALQIFSTLNDRGKPLSDADIFKAQFYKYYSSKGQKDDFIKKWKELEFLSSEAFKGVKGNSTDELFTRYMYYRRAIKGNTDSTRTGLRKFYERDNYVILKEEQTMVHLKALAEFWCDVRKQNEKRFSNRVLRRLFVLNCAPNGIWTYLVSVYFLSRQQPDGMLEEASFFQFLERITAFIWAYTLTNPGIGALSLPIYQEMANVKNKEEGFSKFKFDRDDISNILNRYEFNNRKQITRSMLAWWAFQFDGQELLKLDTRFDTEHIYAQKRMKLGPIGSIQEKIDWLGNKSLLEKEVNIRASDYRFADKAALYKGRQTSKGKNGTRIYELLELADRQTDFTEDDIVRRNERILNGFVDYLDRCGLLKG
jgi:hypothetical protein